MKLRGLKTAKLVAKDAEVQSNANNWIDSKWFRILLITVFALGVFFRLSGLGNKIYSHDEVYTSIYSVGYRGGDLFTSLWDGTIKSADDFQAFLKPNNDKKISEVLLLMALYRPHQAPIFFVLEHYWMNLIGYAPSEMRGLSTVFGLLSIAAFYWFCMELFQSYRTAILATLFFAISPFHILFSQDARPYSLWTLTTLLSCAALLRAMRKPNARNWIVYSLTLILGIYSHQLFILVAIVHATYFIISAYLKIYQNRYDGFLMACIIAFLAYVPWLFFVITRWYQVARQTEVLSMQTTWFRYIQKWLLFFSSPLIDLDFYSDLGNIVPYMLRAIVIAFLVYAVLYLIRHSAPQEKLFLLLIYIITIGVFIVFDLVFGGIRSITGRYFVPANIATILIVAYFLADKLDQTQGKQSVRWRYAILTLVFFGIASNVNSLLVKTWWNKELSRVRTEFINEINKDQTLLIVSGSHPTNLGDVLLLGFEVDQDVHFVLYPDPVDIRYSEGYLNVYWFPGNYDEVRKVIANENIKVIEVLSGTLWQIVEE